jgi:hypothetical protein
MPRCPDDQTLSGNNIAWLSSFMVVSGMVMIVEDSCGQEATRDFGPYESQPINAATAECNGSYVLSDGAS